MATIAFAISLTLAPSAPAAVYWSSGIGFGAANADGSQLIAPLPYGYYPAFSANTCGLEVDAQHLYWADVEAGTVGRANLDGTNPERAFVPGLSLPCGIAVDAGHVYWAERAADTIGRARLDGSGVERGFIATGEMPTGVAVDGQHLYWSNQVGGTIGRARLDGSEVDNNFVPGIGAPIGIAVGPGHVYWGDSDTEAIGRASLDGSQIQPGFIAAAGQTWDMAVDAASLYWADRDRGGGLRRAALDGGRQERNLFGTPPDPTGVAVDSRAIPPSPPMSPRPSDYIRFGATVHDRRSGTVRLIVEVPARGDFRVVSPGVAWASTRATRRPGWSARSAGS